MRKKISLFTILGLVIALVVTLSFSGCAQEAAETTAAETTAAPETTAAETTAAETTAAETTMAEDMDEIDPRIVEIREPWQGLTTVTNLDWEGPLGEKPQLYDSVYLTKGEVEKLRAGKEDGSPYTYAIAANNTAGEYSLAMNASDQSGIAEWMEYCGVEQVAFASAEFDPVKQKADVETIIALEPDIICGYATDPVTGAENFRPAVDAGIDLAFISTVPDGYEYGVEFIGITTNNPTEIGNFTASEVARIFGEDATVGYVFYDDVYFVCNYIDDGFIDYVAATYPDMTLETQGYVAEISAADTATAMITANPDIEVFSTTYMVPAMHIQSALAQSGREDVGIVTFGLDAPILINLIEGGQVKSITTDSPYLVGLNHALQACYALLDKPLEQPSFLVCPTTFVTRDNIREIWPLAMGSVPFPDSVNEALEAQGL